MPKLREIREALCYQVRCRKAVDGRVNDLGYGNNAGVCDNPQPSPSSSLWGRFRDYNGVGWFLRSSNQVYIACGATSLENDRMLCG